MNSNLTYLLAQERAADFARSAEEAQLASAARSTQSQPRTRSVHLLARLFQRRRYDVAQPAALHSPAAIHSPADDAAC
jgi:hypothetical protein